MVGSDVLVVVDDVDEDDVAIGDGVEPGSGVDSDPRCGVDDAHGGVSGWAAGSGVGERGDNCIGLNGGSSETGDGGESFHSSSRTSNGSAFGLAGGEATGPPSERLRSWLMCERMTRWLPTRTLYITLPMRSRMTPGTLFHAWPAWTCT